MINGCSIEPGHPAALVPLLSGSNEMLGWLAVVFAQSACERG